MIQRNKNLIVAEALLKVLEQHSANLMYNDKLNWQEIFTTKSIWLECFDNCREQGYVIKCWEKGKEFNIAFSENRNTDQIVIYCYNKTQYPKNTPTKTGWDDKKYFSYGQYLEAAEYILDRLKQYLEEVEKK